jgi:hypothetical protein
MKEYWLVCAFVRPLHCAKVRATIALSEPLEKFIARNIKHNQEFNEFAITSIVRIDVRKYKALKHFNPDNEGYFRLIFEDYGKIITSEDDDDGEDDDGRN